MGKWSDSKPIRKQFFILVNELLDASGEKGYKKFLFFLIMIDLTLFGSVVADNLLGWSLGEYGEFAWIFLFGMGLIVI